MLVLHCKTFMVDDQTVRELCDRIVRDFQPERIILFGSYAYGNPTPDSDVDLLVVLPFEGKNFWKSLEILNRVNPRFPIDLLARRPDDTERRYRLCSFGKVLYERHN